jgi:hypothetical protein
MGAHWRLLRVGRVGNGRHVRSCFVPFYSQACYTAGMASKYRGDKGRLKAEIVARVTAGESLRAIGGDPGLPEVRTIRIWARADAEFAGALALARVRADEARLRYDEQMAAAFLSRARAGEPINGLLREPGMPGRRAYRHWQATQAPFAEAIFALRQRRDATIGERGRARYRAWDQALADRIIVGVHKGGSLREVLAGDPSLPSRPTLRRWRREQPLFDAVLKNLFAARRRRAGIRVGCTPELTDQVVEHLVMGGSFNSLGREPGMPSRQTLRHWVRVRPEFAKAVAWACDQREDWFLDQIQLIADEAVPGDLARARAQIAPLRRQLARLRHRPGAVHRRRALPAGAA